jgi:hypothetical protein
LEEQRYVVPVIVSSSTYHKLRSMSEKRGEKPADAASRILETECSEFDLNAYLAATSQPDPCRVRVTPRSRR